MHRIRRQILELELPREEGAVVLQRRASRVFQEKVLPRLDEVFSRIAPEGRHVRIERLELDLGDISEANWEQEFIEKCVAEISWQVAEAAFATGTETRAQTIGAEENALEVFKYFLETGRLPWYAKDLTLKELEAILHPIGQEGRLVICSAIRRILKEKPESIERLVWQFSKAFSQEIIKTALGIQEGWIPQAIEIRQSQTGRVMAHAEYILFVQQLLAMNAPVWNDVPLSPAQVAQLFQEELPVELSLSVPKAPGLVQVDEARQTETIRKEETPSEKAKRPDAQGILVDHAGLVLLAVYLPAFFKKLGIELLPSISSDQSAHHSSFIIHHFKAVHLLHFLATGREHPEEPLLVVPKILCGLPLETPISQEIDLSSEEKLEANRLLEAVVRNWPVLKNTSPDGLRATFIQRPGLLNWSEGRHAWVLQVERLGQDLLLEKVPWSFSVVKLGWMGDMVQVEW